MAQELEGVALRLEGGRLIPVNAETGQSLAPSVPTGDPARGGGNAQGQLQELMARILLGDDEPSGPTIDGIEMSGPPSSWGSPTEREPAYTPEDARRLAGASLPTVVGGGLALSGVGAPIAIPAAAAAGVLGDMLERGSMEPRVLPGVIEGATESFGPAAGFLAPKLMRQAIRLGGGAGEGGAATDFFRQLFGRTGTGVESTEELAKAILETPGANISPSGAARMAGQGDELASVVQSALSDAPPIRTTDLVLEAEPRLYDVGMEKQPGPARAAINRQADVMLEGAAGDRRTRNELGRFGPQFSPPGSINPGGRPGFVPAVDLFNTARSGRMGSNALANEFLGSQRNILPNATADVFAQDALVEALNTMAPASGMFRGGGPGDFLAANALAGASLGGPVLLATGSPMLAGGAGLAGMGLLSPRGVSTMANIAQATKNAGPLIAGTTRALTGIRPTASDVFNEAEGRRRRPRLTP
mgnify:CR=1 FL=1